MSAAKRGAKLAAKSKSMATEEIGLNAALEAVGVTPVETDLGEYILQLAGEHPVHIVAPAIEKTAEQVAELLSAVERQAGPAGARGADECRAHAAPRDVPRGGRRHHRRELRRLRDRLDLPGHERGQRAGSSARCRRVHVAIMGMERLVPTTADLAVLLKLLARSGTGQKLTVYTTLLTGPRRPGETDGPEEHARRHPRQRPHEAAARPLPGDARLHPLRRLPERLPGLPQDGRRRLRRRLLRADGRGAAAAARRAASRRRRCRTPRRSAAPALRPAR